MMQQTTLQSWEEVKAVSGFRRLRVYETLQDVGIPISDKKISELLGWPINCVTPRRGELVKMGKIICKGESTEHGRRVNIWGVI